MQSLQKCLALVGLALAVPVFVGSLVACGAPSCQSVCERAQKLDCDKDGVPDNGAVDCATPCAQYQAINSASGCGKSFDEFSSCIAGIADLCVGTTSCDPKLMAWSSCVSTYCAANPGAQGCAQPG